MVDVNLLRNLVPLNILTESNLERLAKKLGIEEFEHGDVIIHEGDTDNDTIYLLEGGVEMVSVLTTLTRVLQGGTEEATYAIAQTRPRQFTVTATTAIKIVRIDNNKLDRAVVLDELTTTITQIHSPNKKGTGEDSKWMEEMLRSGVFEKLPTEKLAPLIATMEQITVKRGDIIVKQGDLGDYYYTIKEGRFNVSRKDKNGKVKILAELEPGNVFGEDSLLSGEARNASIVAMNEGTLMRLAKTDFDKLLKQPLLVTLAREKVEQMLKDGAKLLDVREKDKYKKRALKISINIPLSVLRDKIDDLDRNSKYIVCCETGARSNVAAFLLIQHGFDTYILKGGLQALS